MITLPDPPELTPAPEAPPPEECDRTSCSAPMEWIVRLRAIKVDFGFHKMVEHRVCTKHVADVSSAEGYDVMSVLLKTEGKS